MSSYRLRSAHLHEVAAARGDHSNYAIAKRTGLNQTTLSRICRGIAQPATTTLLALSSAYGVSVDELIERKNDDAPGVEPGAPVGPVSTSTSQQK
ncbi:helix-turn-helix domain-containing protein [Streptomyces tendae]|uniref:helix-turn-helix domain-containing protein n=1 Tax=Streptomyces tendae TaxID=1932 RepID=UPI003D732A90